MTTSEKNKRFVAKAALNYIEEGIVVGVGSGSTVNFFIDALAASRRQIKGAIPSSNTTETHLRQHNIPVLDLNSVDDVPVYVDGADEVTRYKHMIKGGGGALTREKIVAAVSSQFVCIVDESKLVDVLGRFPLPIEVIPMARNHVTRQLAKLGGRSVPRESFITDNGNIILDVHDLKITDPLDLEAHIDHISGVVANGLFSRRGADVLLMSGKGELVVL